MRALVCREDDLRDTYPMWDAWTRREQAEAQRRAIMQGVVVPVRHAQGSNLVQAGGITRLLETLKGGTQYSLTHLEMGTDGTAPTETDDGCLGHVDAAAGVPRVKLTERIISSKTLKTSTFISSSEYNDVTLREAALWDAQSGGQAYNRALFNTALSKTSTETATVNFDTSFTN